MHPNDVYKVVSRGYVRGKLDGYRVYNVYSPKPDEVGQAKPKVPPITLDIDEESLK
jgi:hypothetical protein